MAGVTQGTASVLQRSPRVLRIIIGLLALLAIVAASVHLESASQGLSVSQTCSLWQTDVVSNFQWDIRKGMLQTTKIFHLFELLE